MKKFLMILSILFLSLFTINVNAEEILLCQYNYKSNQEDNGSIYIYMDTSNGKWKLKAINNDKNKEVFSKYDNFDKVFSNAGVGKDVAISTADYNALKNNGKCPSSAIKTNVGSSNIYFGSEADKIISDHSIKLSDAKNGTASYNWMTNADANTKSTLNSILSSGVDTITDDNGNKWVQACNYSFTNNGVNGNVYIYRNPDNNKWKVVSDKGQGSSQFSKEGAFDYVFSSKSTKDVMISDTDKEVLLAGVCPDGALYNTGSGKNDVYIGSKAKELEDNKNNINTVSSGASNTYKTEQSYKTEHGDNAVYAAIYDTTEHIGDDFCSKDEIVNSMRVLGYFLLIAKIFVPLILIAFGTIDMYKAVTGGDAKSMIECGKKLGIRIGLGIAIFLLPTIIHLVLQIISEANEYESELNMCLTCVLKPKECEGGAPSGTDPFADDIFDTTPPVIEENKDTEETNNTDEIDEIIIEN